MPFYDEEGAMKIVKIGHWDSYGSPYGWHFSGSECVVASPGAPTCVVASPGALTNAVSVMTLHPDGKVEIGGVEIVEWSEARQRAMGLKT